MNLLDSQVALITGGAQGIGFDIARTLSSSGAIVIVSDINAEAGKSATREIQDAGAVATAISSDVTSEDDMRNLFERVTSEFGRLDVMVNNAGITRDATLRKMTLNDFHLVVDVHLQGTWLGTRFAAQAMRKVGRAQSSTYPQSLERSVWSARPTTAPPRPALSG